MFSFSDKGITNNNPTKTISFHQLIDLIKCPTNKEIYFQLQKLRRDGDDFGCKEFKKNNIPWITPNAVVRKKVLSNEDDFSQNFIQSSGYIYFDIDQIQGDIESYKNSLIIKYNSIACLISKSSTSRGISLLVRIKEDITSHEEFVRVYDYLCTEYFSEIELDRNVGRLGNTWYVPFDEELYVNHYNSINIPFSIIRGSCNVLLHPPQPNIHRMNPQDKTEEKKLEYIKISTREVFDSSNLETPVEVDGKFLISPQRILQIRFPKIIKEGSRHKVFRKLIHDYMFLNPDSTISHVYIFIKTINENHASPRLDDKLLKSLVENQFLYIKNQKDYNNISKKSLRIIHYQNKGILTSKEKKSFSNKIRGVCERYCTFNRIEGAKNYLLEEYGHYTYKRVAELLGLSVSTVKRSSKFKVTDFSEELRELEQEIVRKIDSKLL